MSVDIFAASKEIAEELEFVARWACAGDDIFDPRPSIERIASFLPILPALYNGCLDRCCR